MRTTVSSGHPGTTLSSSSRPLMPGILMSDSIRSYSASSSAFRAPGPEAAVSTS